MKQVILIIGWSLLGVNGEAQPMKYTSSYTKIIEQPASHEARAWQVTIITAGNRNPLSLIKMQLKNHTRIDTECRLTLYYTGANPVFSTAQLAGTSFYTGGIITINSTQTLSAGNNYFWILADSGCTANHSLQVKSFDLGIQKYRAVWADEFNTNTIDTSNWSFENGFTRNHEHQWYQAANATCPNGILTITAKREKRNNPGYVPGSNDWKKSREFIEYTSASMRTAGKQSWQYGRFEMRARIDTVTGYWPAWWTLGVTKPWPGNGEIDIMEYYRKKVLANYAVGTAQPYKALWYSNTLPVDSLPAQWNNNFHLWTMDWDEQGISIYLDDRLLNYQPQSNLNNRDSTGFFPFKQKHYMLLNLAIGGDNGGDPAYTKFPLTYEVDYVRVSQKIKDQYIYAGTYKPGSHD